MQSIRLIDRDTDISKLKMRQMDWDTVINKKPYFVVLIEGYIHTIGGKYIYVKKVKEKYTMHTRRVSHGSGKHKYYTTETYWTWDYVGKESKKAKKINFCGIDFKSNKIVLPDDEYVDTVKESSRIRYKYYGVGTEYKGTIFTSLKDKTISDKSVFYNNRNINETVEHLESDMSLILFRIGWILLTGLVVFGFYYLDNNWLE